MFNIRLATASDKESIQAVYLSAFSDSESQPIALLAENLLDEVTNPKTLSLVAEANDSVIGHVAFSPITIEQKDWQGYILAPLAVNPEFHGQGAGSALIKEGISQLSSLNINRVFVYGDPAFYGRLGFNAENASGFLPAYKLQYPFGWQAIILKEDCLESSTHNIHCVESLNHEDLW